MNDQKFEQWLQEALATDVTAPEDFTARVMDRVSAMPQEYPKKNTVDKRKLKRMMTVLAACAAIVVLIPVGLMMMPMGKSAPAADGADCAAPEMAMDEAATDTEFFVEDAYNDAAGLERMEEQEAPDTAPVAPADDGGESEMQYTNTVDGNTADDKLKLSTLTFDGDEAAMLHALLTEKGFEPTATEEGVLYYELSKEQTAVLREEVPELIAADGGLNLTLEVAG